MMASMSQPFCFGHAATFHKIAAERMACQPSAERLGNSPRSRSGNTRSAANESDALLGFDASRSRGSRRGDQRGDCGGAAGADWGRTGVRELRHPKEILKAARWLAVVVHVLHRLL